MAGQTVGKSHLRVPIILLSAAFDRYFTQVTTNYEKMAFADVFFYEHE
jgi:hypothetical protein